MNQKRDPTAPADEQSPTDQDVSEVRANLHKLQSQLIELVSPKGDEQQKIAEDRAEPKSSSPSQRAGG